MKDLIYIVMIVFFFFFMFLMSYAFIYGNRDRLKQWLTKVATHQHFPRINTVGGIIAVLLIMFAVSRMVFLSEIPRGIHVDEAGMAYDAFSLAHFGVDRYLYPYPVYFNNYFGGQSVLYGYLCAGLMKLADCWDFNLNLIRTPAVAGSFLTVLSAYGIGRCLIDNRGFGFLCAFLTVVCPYFIMAGRWGLDCNLLLPMFSLAIWMMCLGLKKKQGRYYLLAAVFLGLALYTYALSWIMIPLFLILVLFYLFKVKAFKLKFIFPAGILLGFIATPIILFFAVNQGWIEEIYLDWITINRLVYFRASEISFSNIIDNLTLIIDLFTSDFLPYNSFSFFGTLYLFSIPFTLAGIISTLHSLKTSLKHSRLDLTVVVGIALVSIYCCGLMIAGPNINKLNQIYITLVIVTALGIWQCIKIIKGTRFWIIAAYLMSFILFLGYYWLVYPEDSYPQYLFDDTTFPALVELKEGWNTEDYIVYTDVNQERCGYIFILMANQVNPKEIDPLINTMNTRIGNFSFVIPEQIDTNAIYFLRKETLDISLEQKLIDAGYSIAETDNGEYRIYYFESQKY